ncbi:hypothetical protein HOS53_gp093 [Klebsiella phage May]|uniref:Uncharacterized protein n=1 Tax=Klebsiella phage May TaxID=2054272 RepID=A0A2H5BP07_9CAUD|nr:hypothetical protein HOS53_gp093 [Klebsiella phage May]AUG88067.1 hypothetical protein CPT_May_153 [Klebsiella phage May]
MLYGCFLALCLPGIGRALSAQDGFHERSELNQITIQRMLEHPIILYSTEHKYLQHPLHIWITLC